jgi:alkyl sulfatase BDS1-like metallo-beta-lactamase superfamily hydrolase
MPCTPKNATPATAAANREAVTLCDMGDRQDFADAERALIAYFQDQTVVNAEGKVILETLPVRLPAGRRTAPRHGEPEPVASVAGDP